MTSAIDSEFVQFRLRQDSDPAPVCLLTYTESTSTQPFPEFGHLVSADNEVVRNYTGSCRDFLFQNFR